MGLLRRAFGEKGERIAEEYLLKKGYRILERNFRTRFGEIDLVAQQGDEIVFVEVKARKDARFGYPEESVTRQKLEKISRVGEFYLQSKPEVSFRIDVLSILGDEILHIQGVD